MEGKTQLHSPSSPPCGAKQHKCLQAAFYVASQDRLHKSPFYLLVL